MAAACRELGLWLHVDGAYGLGALCAPSARGRFAGIEQADSFIVDPHKWLFAQLDSCALIYRDRTFGRAAQRQHASYLDALYADGYVSNASDYGVHLTRRAACRSGPRSRCRAPDGYARAVERTLAVTCAGADETRRRPEFELISEPEPSVLAFRRRG
jgi:L-2,4-diaminobutyrate decarboxylase